MLKHKTTCRVTYGDTDKMGYVYHSNYFRWFENWLIGDVQAFGDSLQFHRIEGVFPPVVRGALQV